jgi:hypothetical protein
MYGRVRILPVTLIITNLVAMIIFAHFFSFGAGGGGAAGGGDIGFGIRG